MSNFDESFSEVIRLEGGYVDNPNDRGGETKWGIARRNHPYVDIKNLTEEGAKQIYWTEFWNPLLLARVLDNEVATEIFEQAVNMGVRNAVWNVQRSLCLLGEEVEVDGLIGDQTIIAINRLGQRRKQPFLKCLNGFQFLRYLEIVRGDPTQKLFFVGWLKRVDTNGGKNLPDPRI